MKKFQFSLELVLEQRHKKEMEALATQSRAERMYQERKALLSGTKEKINQLLSSKDNDPHQALHRLMYQEQLQSTLTNQLSLVNKAKQNLNRAKEISLQARKDRLVLDKLKEKQQADYQAAMNLAENKFIDELATGMHFRREKNFY